MDAGFPREKFQVIEYGMVMKCDVISSLILQPYHFPWLNIYHVGTHSSSASYGNKA